MQFTKIAFDGDTVSLRWEDQIAGAVDKHEWSCDEPPTPAFKASLAAFSGFVVDIVGAPDAWSDGLEIRQLTLKVEESGARGLIVTALRKCERAKNRTLLLNTPYMSEPPEGYNGDGSGYLTEVVLELIETAENEAALYRGGERGEQTELSLDDSENTKNVNDRMAAAEVASTRKPKKSKKAKEYSGEMLVMNPESTEVLFDSDFRQLLLMVERDVPIDAITRWTSSDRSLAERWARLRQKEMVGTLPPLETVPPEPECVKLHATLPLSANEWSEPAPKLDAEGLSEIQGAAIGGDE